MQGRIGLVVTGFDIGKLPEGFKLDVARTVFFVQTNLPIKEAKEALRKAGLDVDSPEFDVLVNPAVVA